jgi:tetratricopeptide (TPR) repeat protein
MKDRWGGIFDPRARLHVCLVLSFAIVLFPGRADAAAGPFPHDPSLAQLGVFNRALEKNPDDLSALRSRGSTLRALELYDDALIDFERADKLEPDDAETVIEMGVCHYMLGDSEMALEFLLRAEPLFAVRQEKGDWDFESASEVDKDMRITLFRLFRDRREYEKALEQWERLKKYQSRSLAFRCDRADLLIALGRLDEALEHYEAAVDWNTLFERFCVGAANCYILTGHPEKAISLFDRWAVDDPESPLPFMFRSIVQRDYLNNQDSAAVEIERALVLARARGAEGDDGELPDFEDLITLARVLQTAGDYRESARHLGEFMEYGRGHYLVVHLQACNYRAMGKTAEADSLEAEAQLYRRLNPLDWLQAFDILTLPEARAIPGSAVKAPVAEKAARLPGGGEECPKGTGPEGDSSSDDGISLVTKGVCAVVFCGVLIALILRRKRAKL